MYQGHQVCHWLTHHTKPLFGEREMYVTVQSSLLIILRLPGVCWLEDPRGPPGGAAEQRAPWPGVQRDGTSSTSLTFFPLHGGVGSEQNLQTLQEIHVHSRQWRVPLVSWTGPSPKTILMEEFLPTILTEEFFPHDVNRTRVPSSGL